MDLSAVAPFGQIGWAEGRKGIVILDQTGLPSAVPMLQLESIEAIEEAIKSLRVRGAPLIGITGAMGLAALASQAASDGISIARLRELGTAWAARLSSARPTAVNLKWAVGRMRTVFEQPAFDAAGLADALVDEADQILSEDAGMCRAIGEHGVGLLEDSSIVLTHCKAKT